MDRDVAKERLRYGQILHRTMGELTELLDVPVEKIRTRVEELVKENEYLRTLIWSKTRG